MNLTNRIDQPELMDTVAYPAPVMEDTLRFLGFTNTYFGGTKVVLRHLEKWSQRWGKNEVIKILDIGTGGGEIPVGIVTWARSKKFNVEITAIDVVPEIIQIAQRHTQNIPEIRVMRKNLWDIDETSRFDYVIGSLLLHHIAIPEQREFLQKLDRLAARGIILSDLKRSRLSYWTVSLLSHLMGNAIVKHDGPLSVRRAFTIKELKDLAHSTNLSYLNAAKESWFRVCLSGEKTKKPSSSNVLEVNPKPIVDVELFVPPPDGGRPGGGLNRSGHLTKESLRLDPTPAPSPHGEGKTPL